MCVGSVSEIINDEKNSLYHFLWCNYRSVMEALALCQLPRCFFTSNSKRRRRDSRRFDGCGDIPECEVLRGEEGKTYFTLVRNCGFGGYVRGTHRLRWNPDIPVVIVISWVGARITWGFVLYFNSPQVASELEYGSGGA